MVGSTRVSTSPQALFVSYTSLLGGAERILLDRATALSGPAVLACPDGPLAAAARAAGIEVAMLRERRVELRSTVHDRLATPLRLGAQSREVRRIVGRLRPGCVIGWSMRGLLSTAGALRAMASPPPLVFQHNDLLPSPLARRAIRTAAQRAALVVALSQAIADDLQAEGPLRSRVEVIRPGVDLDRFATASPPPIDPPTALVLGAIVGWKRPDLALEVAALASRELPGLRVRFAGAPIGEAGEGLLGDLRVLASRHDLADRVDFLGSVADVPAALAESTLLLHCADREPYGMALVEGLACGRAVVAPAAAGPLEIVDASCGVLYPPGDAPAAATALVEAIGRAEGLGLGGRLRAEALFDRAVGRERFRTLVDGLAPVP
jgi:glycosyltransferase involved in cell wall biosynthesis